MLIYNLEEGLSIVNQEGNVVGPDFQDDLCASNLAVTVPESRVEESGIVGA